jgi:hypothetical protein
MNIKQEPRCPFSALGDDYHLHVATMTTIIKVFALISAFRHFRRRAARIIFCATQSLLKSSITTAWQAKSIWYGWPHLQPLPNPTEREHLLACIGHLSPCCFYFRMYRLRILAPTESTVDEESTLAHTSGLIS